MVKIFLIGFMGSGKTTVGKKLASLMQYKFIDLDNYIEQEEKATISQLFEKKGEAYFRVREAYYLRTFVNGENMVVSTGGGSPCYHDNMQWMNDHGITVYLEATVKLLTSRLKKEMDERPLLQGKSENELFEFIQKKLTERVSYYNKAQLTVAAGSLNVRKLKAALDQYHSP